MSYLLDTNVVSKLRRVRPHGAVLEWLDMVENKDLHISAVTVGEIQTGIEMTRPHDPREADEIEAWLDQIVLAFDILPMDARTFRRYAIMTQGSSFDHLEDAMIAATAEINELIVVTRNTKDFKQFNARIFNPFVRR